MRKSIIANWKMNLSFDEVLMFLDHFKTMSLPDVIIAIPSIYSSIVKNYPKISFAAQDISSIEKDYGAFTGEISAKMTKDMGLEYAIIGHSERRKYFGESDKEVCAKATNALNSAITPIICIGEPLEVKLDGKVEEFLADQIEASVPTTDKEIIIAYEPVWAIGTGKVANNEDIEHACEIIKQYISKVAKNYSIVYGGSVNSENAESLSAIDAINGLLVGGSSLKFDEFIKIVKAYA